MAKDIFSNLLEEKDLENEKIEILRQYKKIDVLVILKNSKKELRKLMLVMEYTLRFYQRIISQLLRTIS